MKKLITLFALLLSYTSVSAQLRISILTCEPGEELYSLFGHTAIRVIDSAQKKDLVFNYGTFPDYEDGFYLKFIRGKLLYSVEADETNNFINEYRYFKRNITEQVLLLNNHEKEKIYNTLLENCKPENKYYKYDFFFDNCTTRAFNIINVRKDSITQIPQIFNPNTSFRNAIHIYLNKQHSYWNKWGIDCLLGVKCDAIMNKKGEMFLPDVLLKTYDELNKNNQSILESKSIIDFTNGENKIFKKSWFTPLTAFTIIFLLISILKIIAFKKNKQFNVIDKAWYSILGILGILFLFMWFCTDHQLCANNYNLLWANPLYLCWVFVLKNYRKKIVPLVIIATNILVLLSDFILPQKINYANYCIAITSIVLECLRLFYLKKTDINK